LQRLWNELRGHYALLSFAASLEVTLNYFKRNAAGMSNKLKWGIIGTGAIAKTFAKGVAKSKMGEVVAVGSRTKESAYKFADEFKISGRHASYDALLADKNVQAVYIATPHPQHAELAIKSAEAGKHILCEKPIG
jgi:predicted dehydrogenase